MLALGRAHEYTGSGDVTRGRMEPDKLVAAMVGQVGRVDEHRGDVKASFCQAVAYQELVGPRYPGGARSPTG